MSETEEIGEEETFEYLFNAMAEAGDGDDQDKEQEEPEEDNSDQDDGDQEEEEPEAEPEEDEKAKLKREAEEAKHAARSQAGRLSALQASINQLSEQNKQLQAKLDAAEKKAVEAAGVEDMAELEELYPEIAKALKKQHTALDTKLAEVDKKLSDLVQQQESETLMSHAVSEQEKLSKEFPNFRENIATTKEYAEWIEAAIEESPLIKAIYEQNLDKIVDHVAVGMVFRAFEAHKNKKSGSGKPSELRQKQLQSASSPAPKRQQINTDSGGESFDALWAKRNNKR